MSRHRGGPSPNQSLLPVVLFVLFVVAMGVALFLYANELAALPRWKRITLGVGLWLFAYGARWLWWLTPKCPWCRSLRIQRPGPTYPGEMCPRKWGFCPRCQQCFDRDNMRALR